MVAKEYSEKVDPRNSDELKSGFENGLRHALGQVNFKENHTHDTVKMVLGYLSCIVAIGGSAYGFFVPYPACKFEMIVTVLLYTTLSLAWTAYGHFIESNTFYVGHRAGLKQTETETIVIKQHSKKYDIDVTLDFAISKQGKQKKFSKKVDLANFFTRHGDLCYDEIELFVEQVLESKSN